MNVIRRYLMGLIDSKDRLKLYLTSFFWTLIVPYFVKHELKGVLKYIGVETSTSLPQTMTETLATPHHRP